MNRITLLFRGNPTPVKWEKATLAIAGQFILVKDTYDVESVYPYDRVEQIKIEPLHTDRGS